MKISSSFNNINRKNNSSPNFKAKSPLYIPKVIGIMGKLVGNYVNTPEQKLFLAYTGVVFQPLIDLKFADEDKKVDSAIKTASKITACGTTGVGIRAACISLFTKGVKIDSNNFLSKCFFPDKVKELMQQKGKIAEANDRLAKYNKTMGTILATIIMISFTNKHIDAPLTMYLQDVIGGVVKEKKSWAKSFNDATSVRIDTITEKCKKPINKLEQIKNKIMAAINLIKSDNTENKFEGKIK